MTHAIGLEDVQSRIIEIRGKMLILDADIAELYGVVTRDVNKAVANNREKFPEGYVVELTRQERTELVEKFHRFGRLKHSTVNPKAFSEKGLYMLATILKSPEAVRATLAIIETFSKIRELSRTLRELPAVHDEAEQKSLMKRGGELISGILNDSGYASDSETSIELNFAVLKFKHTIKKKK